MMLTCRYIADESFSASSLRDLTLKCDCNSETDLQSVDLSNISSVLDAATNVMLPQRMWSLSLPSRTAPSPMQGRFP